MLPNEALVVRAIGCRLGPRPQAQTCSYQPYAAVVSRLMVATLVIHVITWITTHLPTMAGWSFFVLCQLRECDLGAIVNRDLQQRIRPINGLTLHQQTMKSDVKNAAKIVQNFDNRWKMWEGMADERDNRAQPVSCFL